MVKDRKSPQKKKQLEYDRDHFTFGFNSSRAFPKVWRQKKARVNREYQRKVDALLASATDFLKREDIEAVAEDLTPARLQKSTARERLHKVGTVSVGEKIRRKLERRADAVGRKVKRHSQHDRSAAAAVRTVTSLNGDQLLDFVRRAERLCGERDSNEFKRVLGTRNAINGALHFLYLVCAGSEFERDALRRQPTVDRTLQAWIQKANRIIESDKRIQESRRRKKEAVRLRIKSYRKSSNS
jgi:hypothetical protein